jgi:hypothetical protein
MTESEVFATLAPHCVRCTLAMAGSARGAGEHPVGLTSENPTTGVVGLRKNNMVKSLNKA